MQHLSLEENELTGGFLFAHRMSMVNESPMNSRVVCVLCRANSHRVGPVDENNEVGPAVERTHRFELTSAKTPWYKYIYTKY